MKKVLFRADDLGYSEGVNYGIEKSVRDGLIRSVGIMPNMKAAAHGVKLLQSLNVCLGQHTNICNGRPLTDPRLIPSIVDETGEFKSSRAYRRAKEDFVVLDEVVLEIEAQYQRFKELTGREPGYFEGHAVASRNFFKGLEIVAKRHNLKLCPVRFDGGPTTVGSTNCCLWLESMNPDYNPDECIRRVIRSAREDVCEIYVCHPGYLDAYLMKHSSLLKPRALEVEAVCDPVLKAWIAAQDVTLVTYDDL